MYIYLLSAGKHVPIGQQQGSRAMEKKRVRIPGRNFPQWEVIRESVSDHGHPMYTIVPVDPITGERSALVLTNLDHTPVDYRAWLKQHNHKEWIKGRKSECQLIECANDFANENGGAFAYHWNRQLTVFAESVTPIGQQE